MPQSRPPYPAEFRRQIVELARATGDPNDLAREFEPSAQAFRTWEAEADRSEGFQTPAPALGYRSPVDYEQETRPAPSPETLLSQNPPEPSAETGQFTRRQTYSDDARCA